MSGVFIVVAVWLGLVVLEGARRFIRRRLSNYRVDVVQVDESQPVRLEGKKRVAIMGGGLAGVAAASTLSQAGFDVTVFEAKPQLGGKLASWKVDFENGESARVTHGFHAFFRHYYNLNRFLDSLSLRATFEPVSDYVILGRDSSRIGFREVSTTPVFNLISMGVHRVYRFADVLFGNARELLGVFLEYDEETTFKEFDNVSLSEFDRVAQLPKGLKLAFNNFSRAFFTDESTLSLAELVKAFHFYYLSHDHGLIYDIPDRDYEAGLWAPIRAHLSQYGVSLRLSTPVESLVRERGEFQVNGESFDFAIVAADVVGARAIVTKAKGLEAPALVERFEKLRPGQRYAVLRLWLDTDAREGLPVFVSTDRAQLLDSVSFFHRLERESREWAREHGGSVIELHSYAVPERFAGEGDVRSALIEEMKLFFPELRGARIVHEAFQLERNFTAFQVGMNADRPPVRSGVPGLSFAGDWVKLPFPAMLMEAAFSSGVCAANEVLESCGLRKARVESVPLQGILHGLPQTRVRKALVAQLQEK